MIRRNFSSGALIYGCIEAASRSPVWSGRAVIVSTSFVGGRARQADGCQLA